MCAGPLGRLEERFRPLSEAEAAELCAPCESEQDPAEALDFWIAASMLYSAAEEQLMRMIGGAMPRLAPQGLLGGDGLSLAAYILSR